MLCYITDMSCTYTHHIHIYSESICMHVQIMYMLSNECERLVSFNIIHQIHQSFKASLCNSFCTRNQARRLSLQLGMQLIKPSEHPKNIS